MYQNLSWKPESSSGAYYNPCVPSWLEDTSQKCCPGICNPGGSHDLVPGRSHDQKYLNAKKFKKIHNSRRMLPYKVYRYFFYLTCISHFLMLKNLYWRKGKKSVVKIGVWTESGQDSSKHVMYMLNCHYLGKNDIQTWIQFQPGICEPTPLLVQEHDSFSHTMDGRIPKLSS